MLPILSAVFGLFLIVFVHREIVRDGRGGFPFVQQLLELIDDELGLKLATRRSHPRRKEHNSGASKRGHRRHRRHRSSASMSADQPEATSIKNMNSLRRSFEKYASKKRKTPNGKRQKFWSKLLKYSSFSDGSEKRWFGTGKNKGQQTEPSRNKPKSPNLEQRHLTCSAATPHRHHHYRNSRRAERDIWPSNKAIVSA
ncbi:unnamed protein product [Soboliphyme baturini]|uniref:Secreted protein n=1 Tax=Soboliphyme baturini TaxID=241478 RepID=A0A183INI4_9BILA|nr:unnamed protein product [Soboliphyme baturini]